MTTTPFDLPDPSKAFLTAEAGLAAFTDDPLAHFRFPSERHRDFARALSRFDEVSLRAGNQAAKSTTAAYVFVAIARGKPELDGVVLPMLGTPNVGAVLVKGRAMATESILRCYLNAIGSVPHKVDKVAGNVEAIWVKPDRARSDDYRQWSCIRLFVEGGQSVAGMRLDWAHADEPPDWAMWQELRMRGKANRPFLRAITFTPIDKREWAPVREDFKGCGWPKGRDRKVEMTLSVYDNSFLSPEHLRSVEAAAKGPLRDAKLLGEWVDVTGACPFDRAGLRRWRERCVAGTAERFVVSTPDGDRIVEWEWWDAPDPDGAYMVVADPSAGIEDEAREHDPAGIVVVRRDPLPVPKVVARFNGYIPAYQLGRLSRFLAERYNNALLVWERNGGYGEAFYLGTGEYGEVYIESHQDSLHLPLAQRMGWLTTQSSRGAIIGALQKAIVEDGLVLLSAQAVDSLEAVVIDKRGRSEAGPSSHDEDMMVLGLAAHLCSVLPIWSKPQRKGSERLAERLGVRLRPKAERDPFAVEW